jgi:integrase
LTEREEFEEKVLRRSGSAASLRFYRGGRRKLEEFSSLEHGATIEQLAARLKSGELDVYKTLDRYVGWLCRKGLRPKTVEGYVDGAKKLLRFYDVLILNELFKDKVTLPITEEILDDAPTPEQIRLILVRCKTREKAAVLVLASSGMRLGEAMVLRIQDFDAGGKPARIVIPAKFTKNSKERETYLTAEATKALLDWLEERKTNGETLNPESRLFDYGESVHMAEKNFSHVFRRIMKHFPEMNATVEKGHRVHKIHPHGLRKFFYSRTMPVIGEERAHAIMGHGFYMKTYYKRSLQERQGDYLKCEQALGILSPSEGMTREEVEKAARLQFYSLGIDNSPMKRLFAEQLLKAEELRKGKTLNVDEKLAFLESEYGMLRREEVDLMEAGTDKMNPEKQNQQVIEESRLESLLAGGWVFVASLPSGKIVIRKQLS